MEKYTFENLFITGATGVGKTYLAKKILEDAIKEADVKRETGHDYSLPYGKDIFKIFKCGRLVLEARVPRRATELLEEIIRARGVVLDDLGVFKNSDWIPDIVYLAIDERIERNKPTVVTSNLNLEQISSLIDDRLASRLSSFKQIELTGSDKRLEINIKNT